MRLWPTADTWPEVFDDSEARSDWGWRHDYNLEAMVDIMFQNLRRQHQMAETRWFLSRLARTPKHVHMYNVYKFLCPLHFLLTTL